MNPRKNQKSIHFFFFIIFEIQSMQIQSTMNNIFSLVCRPNPRSTPRFLPRPTLMKVSSPFSLSHSENHSEKPNPNPNSDSLSKLCLRERVPNPKEAKEPVMADNGTPQPDFLLLQEFQDPSVGPPTHAWRLGKILHQPIPPITFILELNTCECDFVKQKQQHAQI